MVVEVDVLVMLDVLVAREVVEVDVKVLVEVDVRTLTREIGWAACKKGDANIMANDSANENKNANVSRWMKQFPTLLTLSRILVVPLIIFALMAPTPVGGFVAAALFIIASLTDYFDGKLARKYGTESNIGKLLDPVADKVLVSSTLVMLVASSRLDPIMVIVLLARDTIISGVRSMAAAENRVIAAGTVGKWKTAVQMVAIPCVVIHEPILGIPVFETGYGILWLSVFLSVLSGVQYTMGYLRK